jgi:murein DD-endopeptidase MepM/ murein hydrolase activator NlpD
VRRPLLLASLLLLAVAPAAAARPDPSTNGLIVRLVVTHPGHVHLLPFEWPAKGSITGTYGRDGTREHPGIDIGILRSLTVRAAAPGKVVSVGYVKGYEGYGKVVLERSGKYLLLYGHLSSVDVRPGQRVARGKPLGGAGCTGWCTGTHLHFEVRKGKRTLDPMRMLARSR